MTQISLIDDGHIAKLERDREHEVDRTPPLVCRQGLMWAMRTTVVEAGDVPATVIDIGAGSGVFGQQLPIVANELGRDAALAQFGTVPKAERLHRVAIEPRIEETPWLARHYEAKYIRRFENSHDVIVDRSVLHRIGPLGIDAWVACNPAFSIMPEIVRVCVPVCRAVLLYGSIAWGCSEAGAALFKEFPPFACARIVGRVHHRGPGINPKTGEPWGADQRDVCWWLWLHGHTRQNWTTCNLDYLPSAARQWTIPPGQEP